MEWKIISQDPVYENKWRRIEEWKMQSPQQKDMSLFVERRRDSVFVFALNKDKQCLILTEYFFSQQTYHQTLVAGIVDNNDPEYTAHKELREETGCVTGKMIYLGSASEGKYVTSKNHYFLALDIEQVGRQELESSEDIQISFISLEEVRELLKQNKLQGAYEVACAYKALDMLNVLQIL